MALIPEDEAARVRWNVLSRSRLARRLCTRLVGHEQKWRVSLSVVFDSEAYSLGPLVPVTFRAEGSRFSNHSSARSRSYFFEWISPMLSLGTPSGSASA